MDATAADRNDCTASWRLIARGRVQGVGFRPYVHQLATELKLAGRVWNHGEGVTIELTGPEAQLECFLGRFRSELPPLAALNSLDINRQASLPALFESSHNMGSDDGQCGDTGFVIAETVMNAGYNPNHQQPMSLDITPDTAPCADCLAEFRDPNNRRYHYPFINCTQCGPRYTLIEQLPYDRPNTSMAAFDLCSECDREYTSPKDRRFHAQPNACVQCGPMIWLEQSGQPAAGTLAVPSPAASCEATPDSDTVIRELLACLKQGQIAAVRGVGGFHLVCDARNSAAIARLRQRKRRPSKPLAVMVADTDVASGWVRISRNAKALLELPAAPIVLLTQTGQARAMFENELDLLAPGLDTLGMMLPQSPLHHLLFELSDDRHLALVMTSGNPGGEPLVTSNEQARQSLADIADVFLMHNREIVRRNDDSVVSESAKSGVMMHRVGRGFAPLALELEPEQSSESDDFIPLSSGADFRVPSVLALGSYLKNSIALNTGERICVSPHIGDLDHPDNCALVAETVDRLLDLMNTTPDAIVCDLHPEGFGRQLGERLAERFQVPLIEVPHHIAHIASVAVDQCMDLSSLSEQPLLGLALDGFGFGWDGEARGGELLRLTATGNSRRDINSAVSDGMGAEWGFEAVGSLSALPQPGADKASREPWRMTLAALFAVQKPESTTVTQQPEENDRQLLDGFADRFADRLVSDSVAASGESQGLSEYGIRAVLNMLEHDVNCPKTTSAGRWFDAVAGLFGICTDGQTYEGEAAMRLEALARCSVFSRNERGFSGEVTVEEPPLWVLQTNQSSLELNLLPLFSHLAERVFDTAPDDTTRLSRLALMFHRQLADGLCAWVQQGLQGRSDNNRKVVLSGGCIQNSLLRQLLTDALGQQGIAPVLPERIPVNDGGISVGQLAWAHQMLRSNRDNNHNNHNNHNNNLK